MQLRNASLRRRPVRYLENVGPVGPGRPSFVHADPEFDKELAKHCAFPSLPMNHPGLGPSELFKLEKAAIQEREKEVRKREEAAKKLKEAAEKVQFVVNDCGNESEDDDDDDDDDDDEEEGQDDVGAGTGLNNGDDELTPAGPSPQIPLNKFTGNTFRDLQRDERFIFLVQDKTKLADHASVDQVARDTKDGDAEMNMADSEPASQMPRLVPTVFKRPKSPRQTEQQPVPDWSSLPDNIKYLIMFELTSNHGLSFTRAANLLRLYLHEQAEMIRIVTREKAKVTKYNAEITRQTETHDLSLLDESIAPPEQGLITEVVTAREISLGKAFLSFMGLPEVAASLGYYQGTNMTADSYDIPINHDEQDDFIHLIPDFNNGCQDRLLEPEAQAIQRPRTISTSELLVRMDPPPGTINPERCHSFSHYKPAEMPSEDIDPGNYVLREGSATILAQGFQWLELSDNRVQIQQHPGPVSEMEELVPESGNYYQASPSLETYTAQKSPRIMPYSQVLGGKSQQSEMEEVVPESGNDNQANPLFETYTAQKSPRIMPYSQALDVKSRQILAKYQDFLTNDTGTENSKAQRERSVSLAPLNQFAIKDAVVATATPKRKQKAVEDDDEYVEESDKSSNQKKATPKKATPRKTGQSASVKKTVGKPDKKRPQPLAPLVATSSNKTANARKKRGDGGAVRQTAGLPTASVSRKISFSSVQQVPKSITSKTGGSLPAATTIDVPKKIEARRQNERLLDPFVLAPSLSPSMTLPAATATYSPTVSSTSTTGPLRPPSTAMPANEHLQGSSRPTSSYGPDLQKSYSPGPSGQHNVLSPERQASDLRSVLAHPVIPQTRNNGIAGPVQIAPNPSAQSVSIPGNLKSFTNMRFEPDLQPVRPVVDPQSVLGGMQALQAARSQDTSASALYVSNDMPIDPALETMFQSPPKQTNRQQNNLSEGEQVPLFLEGHQQPVTEDKQQPGARQEQRGAVEMGLDMINWVNNQANSLGALTNGVLGARSNPADQAEAAPIPNTTPPPAHTVAQRAAPGTGVGPRRSVSVGNNNNNNKRKTEDTKGKQPAKKPRATKKQPELAPAPSAAAPMTGMSASLPSSGIQYQQQQHVQLAPQAGYHHQLNNGQLGTHFFQHPRYQFPYPPQPPPPPLLPQMPLSTEQFQALQAQAIARNNSNMAQQTQSQNQSQNQSHHQQQQQQQQPQHQQQHQQQQYHSPTTEE